MPIKEFECEACHHKFEDILGLNEPNPTVCPKCGKGPLKSLLGSFRIAGVQKKSAVGEEFGSGEDMDAGGMGDAMGGMNGDMGGMGGMGGGDFGGDMGGGDMGFGGDSDAGGDEPPAGEDL